MRAVRVRTSCGKVGAMLAETLEPRRLLAAVMVKDIRPQDLSSFKEGGAESEYVAPVVAGKYAYFTNSDRYTLHRTDGTEAGTAPVFAGAAPWGSNSIGEMLGFQGVLYFAARQGGSTFNTELWRSDGTAQGTRLFKDIYPGMLGSSPGSFTHAGDGFYFVAEDQTSGRELWFSDGTEAGTRLVADIRPGAEDSDVARITPAGDLVYFLADQQGLDGPELWRSDGTAAGTFELLDFGDIPFPANLSMTAIGETLYFITGNQLWKSDGTVAGTTVVTNVAGATANGPPELVNTGNALYFVPTTTDSYSSLSGAELWRSDGTAGGTAMVVDLLPGSKGSRPRNLRVFGDSLLFVADDAAGKVHMYISDGTAAGTRRVGQAGGQMTVVGEQVIFASSTPETGTEIWRSDGTPEGTRMVKDLRPGLASSLFRPHLTAFGDKVLFVADDGRTGYELFITDGTEAGTYIVKNLNTEGMGSSPNGMMALGNLTVFDAFDASGEGLFATDGTPEGTRRISDVTLGRESEGIPAAARVGDVIYFSGKTFARSPQPNPGYELWRTDGTAAGTVMVKDINPGPGESTPARLTALGDKVLFSATNGNAPGPDYQLWVSDGTAAGTIMLKSFGLNPLDPNRKPFEVSNSVAYFRARNAQGSYELWRTDGTVAGTYRAIDVIPGAGGASPFNVTDVNGTLFFFTRSGAIATLWKSNGTALGTSAVKTFPASSGDDYAMLNLNGLAVFSPGNNDIWRSDGTAAGTFAVSTADLYPGFSRIPRWAVMGTHLYFHHNNALWRTDGTIAGTQLVKQFPGASSAITWVRAAEGRLYFYETVGKSVWESDGTAAGTQIVQGLSGFSADRFPTQLWAGHDGLYLSAPQFLTGHELWKIDSRAPQVLEGSFAKDAPGGGVRLSFSEPVDHSLGIDDLVLTHRQSNVQYPVTRLRYNAQTRSVVVGWDLSIPQGDYRLTLKASSVADFAGNVVVGGDFTADFFHLPGDANDDRSVDFADLVAVSQNYGKADTAWGSGDFNGDAKTDFADLVLLAQKYNTSLAAPAAPVGSAAGGEAGPGRRGDVFSTTAIAPPKAAKRLPPARRVALPRSQ